MTRLHDAFDVLVDRGEPLGADAVLARARDAVVHGTVAELQPRAFAPRTRFRMATVAVVCVAVVGIVGVVIVAAASFARNPQHPTFATSSPVVVVRVEVLVGGQVTIHFPGRAVSGQPPQVVLPHGVIRFNVRSPRAADRLVIDGIPKFVAVLVGPPPEVVTEIVRMPPGRYLMHSTLPGHAEAGEEAILIVK